MLIGDEVFGESLLGGAGGSSEGTNPWLEICQQANGFTAVAPTSSDWTTTKQNKSDWDVHNPSLIPTKRCT